LCALRHRVPDHAAPDAMSPPAAGVNIARAAAILSDMQDFIDSNLVQPLAGIPHASTLVGLLVLVIVAWAANWLTKRVLLVVVARLAKASASGWDDAIMGRRVLARLANVVPALVVLAGISLIPGVPEWLDQV